VSLQDDGLDVLLVDGKLGPASGGGTFETLNPATEEVLGVAADGTQADMDAAIGAARRAFDETGWATDLELRVRCVRQLQEALQAHGDEMRALTTAEVGAPAFLTTGPQFDTPVSDLTFVADTAEGYDWRTDLGTSEVMGISSRRWLLREAVGVVGAVTPWNFPHQINLAKVVPALAAGNTVVLKPAPDTPWSATVLGRAIAEHTDIPAGVVNVVASTDHLLGEMLATDPRVDVVTFTGSTATGRRVMANAAGTVKKVFLELGGKSATIMLDDVDLPSALSQIGSVCTHAGQGCAITTRLLLPRSKYAEGVEIATEAFRKFKYGDPMNPAHLMGPVVSERQRERVLGYIAQAQQEGAKLAVGGGVPKDLPKGYFVEPTLFVDVDPKSTLAQEEVFGPVLAVIPFEDDDDAVRIANDSPYGLSGMISSGDLDRAKAVARRIRTGTLGLNGGIWYGADAPFGGYKQSGIGRQCGIEGLEIFTETKTVGWPA
jgi:aldehyde dehydrogenase (NAD+)